jgi:hypothetical protein
MNIPFRNRKLVIELEQVAQSTDQFRALEGASDREMERFARTSHAAQEPRRDVTALMYGLNR